MHGPKGSGLSYCIERGGIVTSLRLGGKEVLYLEEATLRNPTANVRGGIPILFPNAGPIDHDRFHGLKQHGFARTSSDWVGAQDPTGRGFYNSLLATEATREIYPYDFLCALRAHLEDDGSVTLTQEVTNREVYGNLPVAMGLHPYFKVPARAKTAIKFDFPGGKEIEAAAYQWTNGTSFSIANPVVEHPDTDLRIVIPSLGTLVMKVSPEYKRIWIWSLPDKDFVCIEPVMRDAGGLVDDPKLVLPGKTYSASLNLRLEPL